VVLAPVLGASYPVHPWLASSLVLSRTTERPPARCLTDNYPRRIVDLTKAITLLRTMERRMDRYSLEEPPRDEQYDEEGMAEGRRVGILIALVGLLVMTLSVLGGWTPWSL
jgi:hypothetical protein